MEERLHLRAFAFKNLRHEVHIPNDCSRAHVPEVLHVHMLFAPLRLRLLQRKELALLFCEHGVVTRVGEVTDVRHGDAEFEQGVREEQVLREPVGEALHFRSNKQYSR